jgi:hypothetical protein
MTSGRVDVLGSDDVRKSVSVLCGVLDDDPGTKSRSALDRISSRGARGCGEWPRMGLETSPHRFSLAASVLGPQKGS